MYACLHQPGCRAESTEALSRLACDFSPSVETTAPGTVVFSVSGLRRLIGSVSDIAAEIGRRGHERKLTANLALAPSPDAAVLAAMHLPGVTLVPPGREPEILGRIPLGRLSLPRPLQETLQRWGLRTLSDLTDLPPIGLAERLGEEGMRLYDLALGRTHRPLNLAMATVNYDRRLELEDPVSELEPLLFLVARLLNDLCRTMESNGVATNHLTVTLELEDNRNHAHALELPVPQRESKPLLKLLQLELEAHPPPEPVTSIRLELDPVAPRKVQGGLFVPQSPEAARLQLTLARLRGLVGEENIGSPRLENTYRPDAFRMEAFVPPDADQAGRKELAATACLAFHAFRPPRLARVKTHRERPWHVAASGVAGQVAEASGPWRTSGEWWKPDAWNRDEWDVELGSGGIYRLFVELDTSKWFVQGVYD